MFVPDAIVVRIFGQDLHTLHETASKLRDEMMDMAGAGVGQAGF